MILKQELTLFTRVEGVFSEVAAQTVLVHRQVCAKATVETHEAVGPPITRLQTGVALMLRSGLELGSVEVAQKAWTRSRDWPMQEGCALWQQRRASQECFGQY